MLILFSRSVIILELQLCLPSTIYNIEPYAVMRISRYVANAIQRTELFLVVIYALLLLC